MVPSPEVRVQHFALAQNDLQSIKCGRSTDSILRRTGQTSSLLALVTVFLQSFPQLSERNLGVDVGHGDVSSAVELLGGNFQKSDLIL